MEEQLDRLVEKAWKGFLETPENERFCTQSLPFIS
jgi:hypothetical protein